MAAVTNAFAEPHRVDDALASRQKGGDGGRSRTSGAVHVGAVDAWRPQQVHLGPVEQHVDRVTGEVAAFDQHVAGPRLG